MGSWHHGKKPLTYTRLHEYRNIRIYPAVGSHPDVCRNTCDRYLLMGRMSLMHAFQVRLMDETKPTLFHREASYSDSCCSIRSNCARKTKSDDHNKKKPLWITWFGDHDRSFLFSEEHRFIIPGLELLNHRWMLPCCPGSSLWVTLICDYWWDDFVSTFCDLLLWPCTIANVCAIVRSYQIIFVCMMLWSESYSYIWVCPSIDCKSQFGQCSVFWDEHMFEVRLRRPVRRGEQITLDYYKLVSPQGDQDFKWVATFTHDGMLSLYRERKRIAHGSLCDLVWYYWLHTRC